MRRYRELAVASSSRSPGVASVTDSDEDIAEISTPSSATTAIVLI